jgi:hypothetical protein
MTKHRNLNRVTRNPASAPHSCWLPGVLLMAALATGCGSKATSVPPPTHAEAIRDFRGMLEFQLDRLLAQPATAPVSLAILMETIEARVREHGEPFQGYLELAREIQTSWGSKPSAAAVKQGVTALREALAQLGNAAE